MLLYDENDAIGNCSLSRNGREQERALVRVLFNLAGKGA